MNHFGILSQLLSGSIILLGAVGLAIFFIVQSVVRRKRAEAALWATQELHRTVMESAADAIVMMDADSIIVSANAAAERIFGYAQGELLQQSLTLLMPERLRERHRAGFRRYLETGAKRIPWSRVELPGLHKNGGEIPLEISFGEFMKEGRHYFTGVMRDITERKRTEDALREREAQLRSVTDHVPVLIVQCDMEARFKFVNAPYAARFGVTPEQVVGRTICDLVGAAAYESFRRHVEAALRGERVEFEEKVPYVDLGSRWMHGVYVPERKATGELAGFVAVIQDVTQRKQAEEAVRETEARFRALAENIPQHAWMTNPDGWIFWYNQRWFDYTGATFEQAQGWGWQQVHHPDHVERVTGGFKCALESGEPWEDTFPLRGRDGQYRWFLSRAFPIHDEHGKVTRWFGSNTDITASRETQEALLLAQDELKQHAVNLERTVTERTAQLRESIAELESFSYSLSHDMRAPLRAIRGYVQIVLTDSGESIGSPGTGFLEKVMRAVERMDRLIQDVLAMTRISREEVELETVDVEKLIRDIIEERPEFQPARAGIELQSPLLPVRGHEACLTQCLTNLLGNAVKFVARDVRPRVRIWAEPRGDWVRLWIEDNGIGITEDAQRKLFQMFNRIHSGDEYEGTGIGLAIVRKAIERMGGKAGAESEPGKGSRFWLELPRADSLVNIVP
ncbi:MAG: hypothetical protein JWR69_1188 [Pedosphaera sp.]|nr:hypothetical protein [Pedosphaera sp.]